MATQSDKKLCEGLEHLRLADKCMKTSLFKWKPDFDGAAAEYGKAATAFKNAKAFEQAKESYMKAADAQKAMNSPFHAAKSYEQAGLLCKENKEYDEAVRLMEMASYMFQEHGTPDTAAICLEKAAKMVEQVNAGKAITLYKKACEVGECEDRPRQSGEAIGKAARLLVKENRFDEALECLKKEIGYYAEVEGYAHIRKLVMGIILIHLHQEDYVAADLFFRDALNFPEFGSSEEAGALQDLLKAYDDGDDENVRSTLSLPLFKYMDNAFAKLARDMKVPVGLGSGNGGKSPIGGTTGGSGGAGDGEEEDEFPGGLC
ncbi:LOW QUALITY PROTEIN: gamma-soluble NSF attachment protein-like [Babylonia areolata]|uniref:LOW QUALITY PROTEIN: gamma-soluble NSF attachment protein-like n=1 Tax=Babylonia areolata TaxID=304850 RepID=UPI003FCF5780